MRTFLQFVALFILLSLLASTTLPSVYGTRYPRNIEPEFDSRVRPIHRNALIRRIPDAVFIGDSTLGDNVDFQQIHALLGIKTYDIVIYGSASALWYLIIKNNIAVSPITPDYLVLFFRETMLTTPDYRVTGQYFPIIEEFVGKNDDLLARYSYLDQMSWLEKLAERYFPLYGDRLNFRNSLEYRFNHTLPLLLLTCGEFCVSEARELVYAADLDMDQLMMEQFGAEHNLTREQDFFFNYRVSVPTCLR